MDITENWIRICVGEHDFVSTKKALVNSCSVGPHPLIEVEVCKKCGIIRINPKEIRNCRKKVG